MSKKSNPPRPPNSHAVDAYRKSVFYEKLVEHAFISELPFYHFGQTIEVLRAEVDASGYDIVFECNGQLRHVQLKTSTHGAKAGVQKVNVALAQKPSGCVVWILRTENPDSCRMTLSFRFFGDNPGRPLPPLDGFKVAKHVKGNREGVKGSRAAIRMVPKRFFKLIPTTRELVVQLFDLSLPANVAGVQKSQMVLPESGEKNV